jgi:hypothetical protein
MIEDGSEIVSTKDISIYKKSNKTRVFIDRKLSLIKIFEEESENGVEGEREDQKQLESIFEEGKDNNVCDKGNNSEKTKLAYRTTYINGPEDNFVSKSSENKCGSSVIIKYIPEIMVNNTSSVTCV